MQSEAEALQPLHVSAPCHARASTSLSTTQVEDTREALLDQDRLIRDSRQRQVQAIAC